MKNVYCSRTEQLRSLQARHIRQSTWKTVKLGTQQSTNELRTTLMASGQGIGLWANEILGQSAFTVASEEIEVELVQVDNTTLGFKEGCPLRDSYKRARKLGLELCPHEVGPQLRLQYNDQPKDEWLFIAMRPIAVSGGRLSVFSVEHGGSCLWLHGDVGHPDKFVDGNQRFVFARRKISA